MRELWADRDTEDLLRVAAGVTCAATMILGGDDPHPAAATDSLLAALPGARREVIAGAGHFLWAEEPVSVRRLVGGALGLAGR